MKLLLGGSPCTYWSIAQSPDKREAKPEGLGWELFRNYVIALEKYKPQYILYENNYSMAPAIRTAICDEFLRAYKEQGYYVIGHIVSDKKPKPAYEKWYLAHEVTDERMELTCILINSALVSAQTASGIIGQTYRASDSRRTERFC